MYFLSTRVKERCASRKEHYHIQCSCFPVNMCRGDASAASSLCCPSTAGLPFAAVSGAGAAERVERSILEKLLLMGSTATLPLPLIWASLICCCCDRSSLVVTSVGIDDDMLAGGDVVSFVRLAGRRYHNKRLLRSFVSLRTREEREEISSGFIYGTRSRRM